MSTTVTAIETTYGECLFRSRLEAKWAVFFDAMGIEWVYEPQGYNVRAGPRRLGPRRRYLADFFLPVVGLWVEVKGVMDNYSMESLVGATYNDSGLPATPSGHPWPSPDGDRILVLGEIPRWDKAALPAAVKGHPFKMPCHQVLGYRAGNVYIDRFAWTFGNGPWGNATCPCCAGVDILANEQGGWVRPEVYERNRREAFVVHPIGPDPDLVAAVKGVAGAYQTARSARFEHGQTPVHKGGMS